MLGWRKSEEDRNDFAVTARQLGGLCGRCSLLGWRKSEEDRSDFAVTVRQVVCQIVSQVLVAWLEEI